MTLSSLVYIHIGTNIPDYLYDTIYQTLLVNGYCCKIYIIIEDSEVINCQQKIRNFNLDYFCNDAFHFDNIINIIPLSILNDELFLDENFKKYQNILTTKFNKMSEFRDGFWVSTTARFFYIHTFMKMFDVTNVFHIENDVMLYKKINFLYEYILEYLNESNEKCIEKIHKICMIQDAQNRVIPSLLYFPDETKINELTTHIVNRLEKSNVFINDMNLLGTFEDKYLLRIDPSMALKKETIVFDGAAIGQYLGGVDVKNLPNSKNNELMLINNPSKGFINETSVFKPNKCVYLKNIVHIDHLRINPKVFSCKLINNNNNNKLYHIANLHIHSKQLHQFSSILDITYNDIISGDKVIGLCDYVILTKEIKEFHKNLEKFAKDVIIIKDFKSVNFELLNKYLKDKSEEKISKCVNLFLYTHILDLFIEYIFPKLDKSIKYNFYIHNSDHDFNDNHLRLLNDNSTNHIFSQNINTSKTYDKLSLLPLGLANSMWPHGDLIKLYNTIKDTYKYKKEKNIYVNINPNTYEYRKVILEKIQTESNLHISKNSSFSDYLHELANHKFCLCIRGNGIDTHRFWESLYLGVIPVIINNKFTKCNTFVEYLKKQEIPFYEIKNEEINFEKKYNNEFFNETLYKSIIKKYNNFYDLNCLKINYYY
jgi:hypothetical protein